MSTICSGTLEQRLRLCFDLFTEKSSGKISHESLLSLSETLYLLLHTEDVKTSRDTWSACPPQPSQPPILSAPNKREAPSVESASRQFIRTERIPQHTRTRPSRSTAYRVKQPKATLSSRNLMLWSSPADQSILGRQSLPILSPTDALVNHTSDAYSFVTKVAQMIRSEWISYEEWKQCLLTEQGLLQCFQLDSEYRVDTSKLDGVADPSTSSSSSAGRYPARRQMIKSMIVEAMRLPSARFATSAAETVATAERNEEPRSPNKPTVFGFFTCSSCTIT